MISDEVLARYFDAARIPSGQWEAQSEVIRAAFDRGCGYLRGNTFVAWFETDEQGCDLLRAGRPFDVTVVKGGPIFYGWAMLSDGSDRMLYRRLAKASGCTSVVFERWPKWYRRPAKIPVVER